MQDQIPSSLVIPAGTVSRTVPEVTPSVGASCRAPMDDLCKQTLTSMSDEEREAAIYRRGVAMQAWYSQYKFSGDKECLDLAYAAMTDLVELVNGRSPEQIAKLERERGLDLPACANEERAR